MKTITTILICSNFFLTYIVPVLIVLALASLFSFLLSFLGERLKVERDERLTKISKNLPGINCGGCGYAGCEAYAEALLKGEVDLAKCRPLKENLRQDIGQILSKNGEGKHS